MRVLFGALAPLLIYMVLSPFSTKFRNPYRGFSTKTINRNAATPGFLTNKKIEIVSFLIQLAANISRGLVGDYNNAGGGGYQGGPSDDTIIVSIILGLLIPLVSILSLYTL